MNPKLPTCFGIAGLITAMLLSSLGSSRSATAQAILGPIGNAEVAPSGSLIPHGAFPTATAVVVGQAPPLRFGGVDLRPRFTYRFTYGDGVPASPGQQLTTALHEISPSVEGFLGDHWSFEYAPRWSFYSNEVFANTLDHTASIEGQGANESWNFEFSQGFNTSSFPLVETGAQTKTETWGTHLNAHTNIGARLMLDLNGNIDLRYAESYTDANEYSTLNWVDYRLSARSSAGLGINLGYIDLDPGANIDYHQLLVRLNWSPGEKLQVYLHGGYDWRRLADSDSGTLRNPIYAASVEYALFRATTVTLDGQKTVGTSYFTDAATKSTRWSIGVRQRLLESFHLSLGYSRHETTYVHYGEQDILDRDDNGNSFDARLETTLLAKITAAAFFRDGSNASNDTAFEFTTRQIGFEVAYRY